MKKVLIIFCCLAIMFNCHGQSQVITMDGLFGDWNTQSLQNDPKGDAVSIDFLGMKIDNDDEYFYFHIACFDWLTIKIKKVSL